MKPYNAASIQSDNHVHTAFSSDSNAKMEDMVLEAKKAGFSSLCFTDHMDYDFPEQYHENFTFDADAYFQKCRLLQKQQQDFDIRIGIELGLKKKVLEKTLSLTGKYPFDFVIGSTHIVDEMDLYYPEYWNAYGEIGGITKYYETTLENIKLPFDFDVYGHIDYVIRYCPTIRKAVTNHRTDERFFSKIMSEHAEILREILRTLIKKDKAIEINTAGFKYGLGHPNPHETLVAYYKELGGEYISIGSDAHEPGHLGYDFHKVPAILKKAGFSHYTEYHQRKPLQFSLD